MSGEHFALPFDLVAGSFRTIDEGADDEIRQGVAVLLGTRVGNRLAAPDFGILDPTFATFDDVLDAAEIEATLTRFDERAHIDIHVEPPTQYPEADVTVFVSREETL